MSLEGLILLYTTQRLASSFGGGLHESAHVETLTGYQTVGLGSVAGLWA